MSSVQARSPVATSSPRPVAWWLATAASLLAAGHELRPSSAHRWARKRVARHGRGLTRHSCSGRCSRTAAGAQTAVGILTAPDVARVISPGSPCRRTRRPARSGPLAGMLFNASNLPPLPAGHASTVGGHRSGADRRRILTPDAQGSFSETFNTPQDIRQPVAVAVTIEPAGGVPRRG